MHEQNLLLRNDTVLGVCEAIGTDFGIHPNVLRLAFSGAFFFSPWAVALAYVALAVPVALSRWMYPVTPKASSTPVAAEETGAPLEAEAELAKESQQPQLPLAA